MLFKKHIWGNWGLEEMSFSSKHSQGQIQVVMDSGNEGMLVCHEPELKS